MELPMLIDPSQSPMAIEKELTDHYAFFGVTRRLAYQTMHVRLYAIKRLHLENNIHLYFSTMPKLRMCQRGLKRIAKGPRRKLAVSVTMLTDIKENGNLDLTKWNDAVKWTALLTGFFFLLRSGEYLRTEHGVDLDKCVRMDHLVF
jgi:hypothetical protein